MLKYKREKQTNKIGYAHGETTEFLLTNTLHNESLCPTIQYVQ